MPLPLNFLSTVNPSQTRRTLLPPEEAVLCRTLWLSDTRVLGQLFQDSGRTGNTGIQTSPDSVWYSLAKIQKGR